MYTTSSAYKTEILKPSRQFQCRVTIGEVVLDNDDIIEIKIDGKIQPSDSFSIGNVTSQTLDLTILNQGLSIYTTNQAKVEIGLCIGSTIEYVLMGYYNIDDVEKTEYTIKYTCYDNMIKFETPYFSSLGDKPTLQQVVDELKSITGVDYDTTNWSVPNYTLSKLTGYTCREVLGMVASICGGNAVITRGGKFTVVCPVDINYSITGSNYIDYKREEVKYRIGKITCQNGDKSNISQGSLGTDSMELTFKNPWVNENILNDIYTKLNGFEYLGYTMKWQGDISLDPGDVVTVTDIKGVVRKHPILCQSFTYTGGLTSELSAKGESKNKNSFSSSGDTNKRIDRVVAEQLLVKEALINKANIDDLTAEHIKVNTIEGGTATLEYILSGHIAAANIQAGTITAGSSIVAVGAIGSAQISDLDVAKLNAGTIDTTKISIAGANSRLLIRGNRLQVFATKADNSLYERVSIGDVNGDGSVYGFRVRGADGTTVLLDENGVKREGITDGSINNAKIAGDANISGTKLDINSVVTAINGGTTTISGSKVLLNGQTLDVQFNTITNTVSQKANSSEVTSAINGIQVGGRNLLLNSSFSIDLANWVGSQKITNSTLEMVAVSSDVREQQNVNVKPSTQYTFSIDLIDQTSTSSFVVFLWEHKADGSTTTVYKDNSKIFNVIGRNSYTITTQPDTASIYVILQCNNGKTIHLKNAKLEEGNKATMWTPAIEDIQGQIDSHEQTITSQSTQISANATAITLKLDSQTFTKYTISNDKNITNINTHLGEATTAIGTLQGQILLKVSQEDINTSISKMDIGVRNLIFNSVGDLLPNGWTSGVIQDIVDNKKSLKIVTATANELQKASARFKVEPNTTYTVSCYVKTTGNCKGYDVFFLSRKTGSIADFDYINLPITGSAKSTLTYVTGTFTTKSDETEGYIRLDNNGSTDGNDASVWFALLKMIKGNKATDWTPAPEDTQSQIDSATTRISTSEGSIKVLKNAIDLKVSTSDFISANLNLIPDGSFENDGIGWGTGGTIVTDGHVGSKSLKFTSTGTKYLQRAIVVTPGNKYRISYWYKTSADNNGTADNQKLRIGNSSDGTLIAALSTNGVSTTWIQRTMDWVVPSGITSIVLSVGTNLTTGSIQFDDIEFLDITLETRVKEAEVKIRDDSIISTVRSSYLYQNDLNGKTSADDVKSIIQQNSDSIMIGFNNINNKVQITQYSLDIRDYNGKNAIRFEGRQMKMYDYDTSQYLGYFGVGDWEGKGNKGLCINMDEGSFISFGKNDGTSYLTDLAINYGAFPDKPKGVVLFTDIHCTANGGLRWESNTDNASIYFTNVDSSKSELRLEIGDDAADEVCIISELYTSSTSDYIMRFGGNGINAHKSINMNGYDIQNVGKITGMPLISAINHPNGSGTAIDVWTSLNLHNWEINNVQIKAASIQCSGAKNRIVKTDGFGTRALNAVESAECLFLDKGSNKLVNGKCIIPIEPIFAQTITTYVGYDVVLTKYGEGDIFVSQRNENYFVVEAIKDTKDIEFGWILLAKQKGYENTRLEAVAS